MHGGAGFDGDGSVFESGPAFEIEVEMLYYVGVLFCGFDWRVHGCGLLKREGRDVSKK